MGTKFKGIKTAAEYRRGELTKDILRLVAAGIVVGTAGIVAPNTIQLIDYFDPHGRAERNRIWKAIKYLEGKDRVRLEEREGETWVTLTKRGQIQLNEAAVLDLAVATPRRWDKKWRLVLFDLPARYSRSRHSFRHKLEDLGLRLYQKSVFIYPYECLDEINVVAEWYGVRPFVRYVVATEINDMRNFVRMFDLI